MLACYDRTEGSGNALSYAAGIAERTGAHLVVLSVDESMELDCPADGEACRERVASEVGRVVEHCTGRCDVAIESGDPVDAIERLAGDLQADLIVLGRARHPWLHPRGSVPARLSRRTHQPVLIVP